MTPQCPYYLPSGWCICGHHRDDGRNARNPPAERLTRSEIRALLGPTYQPKEKTP